MKKETTFLDTKIKISSILMIIIAVFVLWFFANAKISADKYEGYQNELDYLTGKLDRIAYEDSSLLELGVFTTQEAMQEVYDLEKEFEELKKEIIRASFEGTRELILDIRMESVEFAIVLEKQIILKVHKMGWDYEGEEYRAFLDWSWNLNEIEREREFEKIRLGK